MIVGQIQQQWSTVWRLQGKIRKMTHIFSRWHALVDQWLSWYGHNIYAGIDESNKNSKIINNELKDTILQMRLVIVQTTNNEQLSSVIPNSQVELSLNLLSCDLCLYDALAVSLSQRIDHRWCILRFYSSHPVLLPLLCCSDLVREHIFSESKHVWYAI